MGAFKRKPVAAVLGVSVILWLCSLSVAGDRDMDLHLSRPPDIPTERLDRPRSEQDRSTLRQSEAVALASAAAKKKLGRSFDEYRLKAAVFNPSENSWTVTFNPIHLHIPSEACVVVVVRADTRATDVLLCS